jgi:hypothetical protein
MIEKHLGEQGVEALVCEHFAKGSKGATGIIEHDRRRSLVGGILSFSNSR